VGFASIGAFIMLFFSLIIIISTFIIIQGRMVETTQLAMQVERDNIEHMELTRMEIVSLQFDNLTAPDNTSIVLNNTGRNKIEMAYLDVWIDRIRLPRDSGNRTIEIVGQNAVNPLHWDPGETVKIDVMLNLATGTHRAIVSTEYGVQAELPFTT
jgi:archaellum component FlaF (FlaF/FlaG flagellin family)